MTIVKTRKPIKVIKFVGKAITKSDYIHNYEMANDHNETISYGFGQLDQYSDYRPKISNKLKAELEELEKEWDKEPLPF